MADDFDNDLSTHIVSLVRSCSMSLSGHSTLYLLLSAVINLDTFESDF